VPRRAGRRQVSQAFDLDQRAAREPLVEVLVSADPHLEAGPVLQVEDCGDYPGPRERDRTRRACGTRYQFAAAGAPAPRPVEGLAAATAHPAFRHRIRAAPGQVS
jgi:hypothetical protein